MGKYALFNYYLVVLSVISLKFARLKGQSKYQTNFFPVRLTVWFPNIIAQIYVDDACWLEIKSASLCIAVMASSSKEVQHVFFGFNM